ncbi:hypothetical protein GGF42_006941, partial [Coemansia sp. RSA 2424]
MSKNSTPAYTADTTRPPLCTRGHVSAKKDDSATLVRSSSPTNSQPRSAIAVAASATTPRSYRGRSTRVLSAKSREEGGKSPTAQQVSEDTPSSWLGRLWCGIRRRTDAIDSSSSSSSLGSRGGGARLLPGAIAECGGAAVGPVRDPHIVIPADIMFSPQRTALYANMVSMLVRNPFYLTRIVSHVKHHECDALLSIILDSLFSGPVYEPLLTALFT